MPNNGNKGFANARLDDEFAGWIFGSLKPKKNNLNEISTDTWQHYQMMISMGTNK